MNYFLDMDGFWSSRTARAIGYAMWLPVAAAVVVLVDGVYRLLGG